MPSFDFRLNAKRRTIRSNFFICEFPFFDVNRTLNLELKYFGIGVKKIFPLRYRSEIIHVYTFINAIG